MTALLNDVQAFIKEELSMLAWLVMCNFSVVLIYINFDKIGYIKELMKPVIHMFNAMFGAFVLAYVISKISKYKILRPIKTFGITLAGIVFVADLYTYIVFSSIVNQSVLEIIMTVDGHVVVDYLRHSVSLRMLPISIVFFLLLNLLYRVVRRMLSFLSNDKRLICIFGAIICCAFFSILIHRPSGVLRDFSLTRLGISAYNAYDNVGRQSESMVSMRKELPNEIVCNDNDVNVVVVLGESVDRNHMGIYGYDVDNTPYISRRIANGEVYVYNDVISSANFTTESMRMMFTYANKGDSKHWYENANVFEIAKAAGYELTWLSNQNVSGLGGSMDKVYSDLCDKRKFTILGDFNETIPYDEELLSMIDTSDVHGPQKFTVIHLEGSHEPYYLRYPKRFDKYSEDSYDYPSLKGREILAEYDNTILYTDYILEEIIKRYENDNAVIIYVSDHGAEVYNDRDYSGHSIEEVGNKHMIEIPMFIWVSNKYKLNQKDMIDRMMSATNRPFMTDDFIYVLTDLLNINIPSKIGNHSILSNEYIPSHDRIYNNKKYEKM
jgi:heptose-I-phosphate ethanolaminephosphotransferase